MTAGTAIGEDRIVMTEGPAMVTWNGEEVAGRIEKSRRPSCFGPEA